jgi:hypothetical protein
MARSKDPLTAAMTSILKPGVAHENFRRLSGRVFARVTDDILQFMYLQLSAYGSRDFCVNYSSIPLFAPREHLSWLIGGRFPRGKSHDGWWASATQDRADQSMREVVATFQTEVLPWFAKTENVVGLLAELEACGETPNAHLYFEIGCCHLWLSDRPAANVALNRARELYQGSYEEMPSREWCLLGVHQCDRLLEAIANVKTKDLLDAWRHKTITKLKLDRLIAQ